MLVQAKTKAFETQEVGNELPEGGGRNKRRRQNLSGLRRLGDCLLQKYPKTKRLSTPDHTMDFDRQEFFASDTFDSVPTR